MAKPEALMSSAQLKKRLCCPPLAAEVAIYEGMAEALPDDLLSKYNDAVDNALAHMKSAREQILAALEARR